MQPEECKNALASLFRQETYFHLLYTVYAPLSGLYRLYENNTTFVK